MAKQVKTGKTILKTSLMTLLGLLFAAVITVSALCFALPGTMSAFTGGIGMRHFAAYLAKAQYEKTDAVGDLGTLVARAEMAEDFSMVAEYSEKLLSHAEFAAFCAYQNTLIAENPVYSGGARPEYRNYIQGNYVYALYRTGRREEAYTTAQAYLPQETAHYVTNNPMTRFIGAYVADASPETDAEALSALLSARYAAGAAAYETAPDAYRLDLKNLCMDLYLLAKRAGDAEAKARWETEFSKYILKA